MEKTLEYDILRTRTNCTDDSHSVQVLCTKGLNDANLPNIILIGEFRIELAVSLIEELMKRWLQDKSANREILTGFTTDLYCDRDGVSANSFISRVNILSENMPQLFKELIVEAADTLATGEYYDSEDDLPEFVQIVWTDKQGNFPWHHVFDKKMSTIVLPHFDEAKQRH